MILVNTLAIVAVATAMTAAMLDSENPALDRTTRFRTAGEAAAIARGGELSAMAALRRDTARDSDDRTEAWAHVAQALVAIHGGSFTLAIGDAQGRYNVNEAGADATMLAAICRSLRLPDDLAGRIATAIGTHGAVSDLDDLRAGGIDPAAIAALRPLVTALPGGAPVNLNAASPVLLGILLDDAALGARLAARREAVGRLTPSDIAAVPSGAGFTSDHFTVTTTVTIGGTTRTLVSLLERGANGRVATIARGHGPAR